MTDRPVVVWFRRDLRLHDHPALTEAASSGGPLAALFVFDPALLHGRFASANRAWFLTGCVAQLRRELERRGARLSIRVGHPVDVVPAFAREVDADGVTVSRDYTPYGRRRDRAVAAALHRDGRELHAKRGVLIHEPEDILTEAGTPYAVFSPFLRRWTARRMREALPPPATIATVDVEHDPLPDMSGLGVDGEIADRAMLPEPGEAAARDRLETWLASGPDHGPSAYHRTRDRLADPRATSRLGADLRFGTLSPVEVATRAMATDGDGEGARRFVSELAWRDFYAHTLWHAPRVAREAVDRRYLDLAWERDEAGLEAWRTGRTGYPIVDAAMRQLRTVGWLPNRARMIVASFLTKDLLIDWRDGERHFMAHLIDGDPASNLGGWQWAASTGTDARPFVQIFNPVTQAKRFDPDGTYVRAWLPELGRVDDEHIHEPWTMSDEAQTAAGCRIGLDYPAPIVDHAAARRRATARYTEAATNARRGGSEDPDP